MAAYDMPQREQSARPLHLTERLPQVNPEAGLGASIRAGLAGPRDVNWLGADGAPIIDILLDRLADRVAAAVIAQIGKNDADQPNDWLDSREAAEYLGLHRDTLRRLAAARTIPAEQDGRGCKLFFRRATLDEWRRTGGQLRHLAAVANAA